MAIKKLKKKNGIRNNEYYNTQSIFDDLYSKAKQKYNFKNLLNIITSYNNVLLAYRNIKKNKGSKTKGTNKSNIIDVGKTEPDKLVKYVKDRLANFKPHSIRRVEIEKDNGTMRPLGIPTIEDRLIQQCIKQVLEPICEAYFHKHSYGFRPNRSTHHAIARVMQLTNRHDFKFVIDIDIKGFFDNVNQSKLIKQLWSIGIKDKNLLCIISKMLKAEIKGLGIPGKGVPQGGILSPLLSNVVLNELDWWISSQWETYITHTKYKQEYNKYRVMDNTNLKKVFIVRYADDVRLFCKDYKTAEKIFNATKNWLKERLSLEINSQKSKIVNLNKKYSEFLGIRMKLRKKGNKYVIKSYLTKKSVEKCTKNLKAKIKEIQKKKTANEILKYNASIIGIQNYYKVAVGVSIDFRKIAFNVSKSLKCRCKSIFEKKGDKSKAYKKFYKGYSGKVDYICGIALFPISYIKNEVAKSFIQGKCDYTITGREKIHTGLKSVDMDILQYIMKNSILTKSSEYNDNRVSLYVGQQGKCYVTDGKLMIGKMEVHHKKPKSQNGSDEYKNLVFVTSNIHKLIHATDDLTISKYLGELTESKINYARLNKLRRLVGNYKLSENK